MDKTIAQKALITLFRMFVTIFKKIYTFYTILTVKWAQIDGCGNLDQELQHSAKSR